MYLNYILLFIFGVIIGSSLNVCVYRIPRNMSIVYPSSHCPNCNNDLSIIDLIPVLSFLIHKGKCRYCKTSISLRYPIIELLCGLGSAALLYKFGLGWELWTNLVLFFGLVVCSFIDIDLKIIPDKVLLFLLIYGVIMISLRSKEAFISGVIGFIVGGILLLILSMIYENGLGGGDVKLVSVMGIYLGWKHILMTLWIASILAIIVFIILNRIKRKSFKEIIPFGPFLSIGAFMDMLLGEKLINTILNGNWF